MADAQRRFIRIYHIDLQRDYPEVWYDPTAGWTFTRLLAIADLCWPATPELYRAVRRADLTLLERVGLVTLMDNHRYVIKGYEAERSERAEKARNSVNTRYGRSTVVERSNNVSTTARARAVGAGSSDTGTGNGTNKVHEDPADAYWSLTGRYPTDKVLAWVDDLTAKFGAEPVIRALAQAHIQDSRTNTLLGRTQDLLRSEARALNRKEQEDERARLREKRAIPKVLPAWEQEFRAVLEAKYGAAS